MIKNQKRIILIGAILLAVLIPVYIFVVAPLLKTETTKADPPTLLPGEVLGSNNRILMFEHVERAAIQSIEVHNDKGSYTFYLDKDGNFYIKNLEGAPYNLELFSSLVVSAGNTLTLSRVVTDCEDLAYYGLSDADNPAWYVLTTTAGTQHKVYIGKQTVSASGYYVRYEGRNAVYILDATIESTLLASIYSMITPILAPPLNEETYYKVDNFMLLREDKVIVAIDYLTEEEHPTESGMGDWKMIYPGDGSYVVNSTSYSSLLEHFTEFVGSETVEFGSAFTDEFFDKEYSDGEEGDQELSEDMQKYHDHLKNDYGIDVLNPYYMVTYTANDLTVYIIFSKPDLSGNMYAYSSLYDLVAKINISEAPFLDWDVISFVDRPIFAQSINTVAKMEVKSELINCTFFLDGEGQNIKVTTNLTAKPFGAAMYRSFQEWYREFVSTYIQDMSEFTNTEELPLYATIIVTFDSGEVTEYRFYPYSTRRCFVTINGKGEFYVLFKDVERVISDAKRLMEGKTVDADAEY